MSLAITFSSNSALTILCCQIPGGGSPGSPKIGCSSGVSALASSMLADNAPNSMSVSLSRSAVLLRASILSDSQAMLFVADAQLLFQIMNAGATSMKSGIGHQITMQRHVGF